MKYLYIYLAIVNLLAFFFMGFDKRRAINGERRIRESTLFLMAIIGGSVGAIAGMLGFRHKTKHAGFTLGLPVILAVQGLAAWFAWSLVK